ncbi:hypothetical protein CTAYLR_001086 [Chrysophaeum taylorii]|uniref:Cytochrome b5 heme-binding domain-containing protein n=1 Tax=Chrysophaeum taylorii TaxID=2483200 RepID=A0AAD7XQ94_9STRA|nr:hypothetical protein CTAYLR_001086 [Chrysophaeum taylorii]
MLLFENWPIASAVVVGGVILYAAIVMLTQIPAATKAPVAEEAAADVEPPRDFTLDQLREFDGVRNAKIYVGLKGEVFDVSRGVHMYGPEGPYAKFAGHECSKCLATMSLEDADLDALDPKLNPGEADQLDEWYHTFKHAKQYPVVGKVSVPPTYEGLSVHELRAMQRAALDAPPTRDARPHPALGGCLRRRADLDDPSLEGLGPDKLKILQDWENLFKRKYPPVGTLAS